MSEQSDDEYGMRQRVGLFLGPAVCQPLDISVYGRIHHCACHGKTNLHRRIALNIVSRVGTCPTSIILGFMVAAAFLRMWVSNTATAMMMLPIALSIISLVENEKSIIMPVDGTTARAEPG